MNYDINIVEGVTFAESMRISSEDELGERTPIDLTGYSIRSQIRRTFNSNSPIIKEFTVTIPSPETGELSISLTSAETKDLTRIGLAQDIFLGYYDIFVTHPSGKVSKLLEGKVKYTQSITEVVS